MNNIDLNIEANFIIIMSVIKVTHNLKLLYHCIRRVQGKFGKE